MTFRWRTGAVALGLLMALATLFGVACLCVQGPATPPEHAAVTSVTSAVAQEHVCPSPVHRRCGADAAVVAPTTGPGSHPQPLVLPTRADTRPPVAFPVGTSYAAGPRAPDLHVLQVLRT